MNEPNKPFNIRDESGFRELFSEYYDYLFHFAFSLVQKTDVAANVVVETFRSLWQIRDRFDSLVNVKSYLYTTAKNACSRYLLQNKIKPEIPDEKDTFMLIVRTEFATWIVKHISALPEGEHKRIAELAMIQGMSDEEIATQLNRSVDYVSDLKREVAEYLPLAIRERLLKINS